MRKCAFLSMDDLSGYQVYDELLIEPLAKAGWLCDVIPWRQAGVNWNNYEIVIIRSTWDYQKYTAEFLRVLSTIDQSTAYLANPMKIVEWNINKQYLRELESKGVLIVATEWRNSLTLAEVNDCFSNFACDEMVIKPCISAGAFDIFRVNKNSFAAQANNIISKYQSRDLMIQPFEKAIIEEGEFSLFYFDGCYSHTVLKKPKANDFRVQEEFGGLLVKVEPEKSLMSKAQKVIDMIEQDLLYARLDFVRTEMGFALMEVELIEPSLYFKLDPSSPQKFVDALLRTVQRIGKN